MNLIVLHICLVLFSVTEKAWSVQMGLLFDDAKQKNAVQECNKYYAKSFEFLIYKNILEIFQKKTHPKMCLILPVSSSFFESLPAACWWEHNIWLHSYF